jgi:hypothetical protein
MPGGLLANTIRRDTHRSDEEGASVGEEGQCTIEAYTWEIGNKNNALFIIST